MLSPLAHADLSKFVMAKCEISENNSERFASKINKTLCLLWYICYATIALVCISIFQRDPTSAPI